MWLASKCSHPKQTFLHNASAQAFHGIADSIYRETQNHNIKVVRVSDGYVLELSYEWENLINIGDSLSKKRGELQVKVIKSNGKVVILDYNQIAKEIDDWSKLQPSLT